jgi:hypothetical protein
MPSTVSSKFSVSIEVSVSMLPEPRCLMASEPVAP